MSISKEKDFDSGSSQDSAMTNVEAGILMGFLESFDKERGKHSLGTNAELRILIGALELLDKGSQAIEVVLGGVKRLKNKLSFKKKDNLDTESPVENFSIFKFEVEEQIKKINNFSERGIKLSFEEDPQISTWEGYFWYLSSQVRKLEIQAQALDELKEILKKDYPIIKNSQKETSQDYMYEREIFMLRRGILGTLEDKKDMLNRIEYINVQGVLNRIKEIRRELGLVSLDEKYEKALIQEEENLSCKIQELSGKRGEKLEVKNNILKIILTVPLAKQEVPAEKIASAVR
jgi:hypothetical protein